MGIAMLGVVRAQAAEDSVYDFWFYRLLMNLAGYASLIIPAFFYKRYLDNQGYKSSGSNKMLINFFYGTDIGEVQPDEENLIKKESATPKSRTNHYANGNENFLLCHWSLCLLLDMGRAPGAYYHPRVWRRREWQSCKIHGLSVSRLY